MCGNKDEIVQNHPYRILMKRNRKPIRAADDGRPGECAMIFGVMSPVFRNSIRGRFLCLLLLGILGLPGTGYGVAATEDISIIRKGVIKITVIAQIPDYVVPWNPGRMDRKTGTGFVISGRRILTNAHIASNARFIAVEKEGDSRRYEARVKFVAHDCDLAMLEVPDESFFEGTAPLSIGGVPALNSVVAVLGYPVGGRRLSVTRGVVSRIDYQVYSHSMLDQHLAIQIDAAINPGNSGGPVVQENAVVGVAFQGYRGDVAQNVGYMIPEPVIHRFLKDVEDGSYDRYVDLGIRYFPLINRTQRRAMGLGQEDRGVMVTEVYRAGPCDGILKSEDILLSIDDLPIFSDGYVQIDGERLHMAEVVERKFMGDRVRLKILREKKPMEVTISLTSPWPFLMQTWRHDVRPRFVFFGGLVFQPLSRAFIKTAKLDDIDILYHFSYYLNNELYIETPEIVVLSKVLPDPINVYLQSFVHSIIVEINGKKIRTLEDVSAAFKEPVEYHVIRLQGKDRPLVVEQKAVEEARDRILSRYGVRSEEYLGDSFVPADWSKQSGSSSGQ